MFEERVLGRTGLRVCPLGISASYGVPTAAVERAVEAGVNYLYWGSIRRAPFGDAIRHFSAQRDRLAIVLQSYAPTAGLITRSLEKGLSSLGLDRADVLLLGYWNRRVPPPAILDACRRLQERGLVRSLGLSSHNRLLLGDLAAGGPFDVLHVRYNAVHRGAETEVFPRRSEQGPGLVSFTATCWRQLLGHRRIPAGERVPTATDCYRFVLSQPAVGVCMTGPSTADHVAQALEALRLGPLDPEQLAWMRRVGDAIYGKPRSAL